MKRFSLAFSLFLGTVSAAPASADSNQASFRAEYCMNEKNQGEVRKLEQGEACHGLPVSYGTVGDGFYYSLICPTSKKLSHYTPTNLGPQEDKTSVVFTCDDVSYMVICTANGKGSKEMSITVRGPTRFSLKKANVLTAECLKK